MSKTIQDPIVTNYITAILTNTQNGHYVGNPKWSDGMSSDVVLESKLSILDLPPVIPETQHTVDHFPEGSS